MFMSDVNGWADAAGERLVDRQRGDGAIGISDHAAAEL